MWSTSVRARRPSTWTVTRMATRSIFLSPPRDTLARGTLSICLRQLRFCASSGPAGMSVPAEAASALAASSAAPPYHEEVPESVPELHEVSCDESAKEPSEA